MDELEETTSPDQTISTLLETIFSLFDSVRQYRANSKYRKNLIASLSRAIQFLSAESHLYDYDKIEKLNEDVNNLCNQLKAKKSDVNQKLLNSVIDDVYTRYCWFKPTDVITTDHQVFMAMANLPSRMNIFRMVAFVAPMLYMT